MRTLVERRSDSEERRVENNIAARSGDEGGTKAECHEFRLAWPMVSASLEFDHRRARAGLL